MPLSTDGVPSDDKGVPMETKVLAAIAFRYCKDLIIDSIEEKPKSGSVGQLLANRNAYTAHPASPLAQSAGNKETSLLASTSQKNSFGERLSSAFNHGNN